MTTPVPAPSGWKCSHPRAASGDGHGAVPIRAQHSRPTRPQLRERTRCGVSVAVARADGDDRESWPDPVLQTGVLVRRAVVGHLEHVHRAQFRMRPQEGLLGGRFEVSRQQQRQTRRAHQQDDARVVGAVRGRAGSRRPEHLPFQRPGPAPLPRRRRDDGDPGGRRGAPDHGRLRGRLLQDGGLDHTDGAAPQHPGQPSHVVGVKMRQQEQWDASHTQGPQAGVDRAGLRTGVHDDGRPGTGGEDGGVPLPHRALRVGPVRRRPAGDHPGRQRRPHHRDQQQHHQAGPDPAPPSVADSEPDDGRRDEDQEQPSAEPAGPGQLRPRQPGPRPRHGRDPPRRYPRAPGERLRRGQGQRGHCEDREAEHRGRTRRQLRQQVAGHRDEAHPGGEHDHHRRAHRLRRGGRPERVGEPRPHPPPPQGLAPPRPEGEQRPGGQHGEQETVAARQPRVVQHQQHHGRGQRRDQGPAPPGGEGEQGHRPAGGGPQHARLGPAHHHERQRQRGPAQGRGPQRQPQAGREPAPLGLLRAGRGPDEQVQHHGQVGPGDGQQVQQIGGLERRVQVGRHPGGVADHQPRQQGPRVGGEPFGGLPQPGPQAPRQALRRTGAAAHPGRGADGRPQQRHGPFPVQRRCQPGGHRQPGRGLQRGPSRVPGQHPHRCPDPGRHPVGPGHPGHHRVQDHPGRPAPAPGGAGVRADGELHQDPGVLPGQPGHGPRPRLRPLQPGHPRPGGRAQQRGGRGRTYPPQRLRPAGGRQQQHPRHGHREPRSDGGPRPGQP